VLSGLTTLAAALAESGTALAHADDAYRSSEQRSGAPALVRAAAGESLLQGRVVAGPLKGAELIAQFAFRADASNRRRRSVEYRLEAAAST